MCCNCTVTHGFGCVHSITPNLFICSPCDNDARFSATPPPPTFACYLRVLLVCLHISICRLSALLVDCRKCFCAMIWLGISSDFGSNDPCWEVLQEQIWRRYPVNKEPAETSCEQHCSRCVISSKACPCQTVGDMHITYFFFFIVIEYVSKGKLDCFSWEQIHEKWKVDVHCFSFWVCGMTLKLDLGLCADFYLFWMSDIRQNCQSLKI